MRNVAEDVLREFESRWWGAARKGDVAEVTDMLAGGREVLATTVDDNGRTCARPGRAGTPAPARLRSHAPPLLVAPPASALHYACGIGSEACVTLLLDNGADVSAGVRRAAPCAHARA